MRFGRKILRPLLATGVAIFFSSVTWAEPSLSQDDESRVLNYEELMRLSDQDQLNYVMTLQDLLIEVSVLEHSMGGRLVADQASPQPFLAFLSKVINQAAAADDTYHQENWEGVEIPVAKLNSRGDLSASGSWFVRDEKLCTKNAGHVLISYERPNGAGSGTRCVSTASFKALAAKPEVHNRWKVKLGTESQTVWKNSPDYAAPQTPQAANASQEPLDGAAKIKDAKEFKGKDGKIMSCISRDQKGSRSYQDALRKYHALKNNQCIYAGFLSDYYRKSTQTERASGDIRGANCVRRNSASIGPMIVKCQNSSEILCNPLLFGISSEVSPTEANGRCVPRGAGATVACNKKFMAEEGVSKSNAPAANPAQAQVVPSGANGAPGANGGPPRNGATGLSGLVRSDFADPTGRSDAFSSAHLHRSEEARASRRPIYRAQRPEAPANGGSPSSSNPPGTTSQPQDSQNFWQKNIGGIREAWNSFADNMSGLCNKDEFRVIHCEECSVIKARLKSARAAFGGANPRGESPANRARQRTQQAK